MVLADAPDNEHHLEAAPDLALLLGARQADIMRRLWTHGPATVRQLHSWLWPKVDVAYTTVMTLCVMLPKKGVLERHQLPGHPRPHARTPYISTPRMSEAEFVRTAIEWRIAPVLARYPALVHAQITGTPPPRRSGNSDRAQVEQALAYLGALRDAEGRRADDTVLDTVAALLERAEAAEESRR